MTVTKKSQNKKDTSRFLNIFDLEENGQKVKNLGIKMEVYFCWVSLGKNSHVNDIAKFFISYYPGNWDPN